MASKWTGLDAYYARLKAAEVRAINLVHKETLRSAETIRRNVATDIQLQGAAGVKSPRPADVVQVEGAPQVSGGVPGRRKKNAKHIPSKPFHPPNSDTGRLAGSYTSSLDLFGKRVTAWIGSNVRYAKWLEDGTSRMQPRPVLRPRFYEEVPRYRERLMRLLPELFK